MLPKNVKLTDLHARCSKAGIPASPSDLNAAAHFVSFAMASYGALYYVYVNPRPVRFAELCCYCCCPGQVGLPFGDIRLPHPFSSVQLSKDASSSFICNVAGIPREDLLYVNNTNKFNEQAPYFIALDHMTKSIVISIRGTLRSAPNSYCINLCTCEVSAHTGCKAHTLIRTSSAANACA
jgi:hypothetical protein